jgi:hypothetical protein
LTDIDTFLMVVAAVLDCAHIVTGKGGKCQGHGRNNEQKQDEKDSIE